MTGPAMSIELASGVTLQYVEQGDPAGLPVLCLHGLSDSWYSFARVLPHLPRSLRVLVLTQRGHGDASRPARCYHTHDLAADAAAFLAAQRIASAVIVGHSMGSSVAQRFAIDYPERTLALVLVAAFHSPAGSTALKQLQEAVASLEEPVDPGFVHEFQASTLAQAVPPAFFDTVVRESCKMPAWVWRELVDCHLRDEFSAELAVIRAPTLLVWGDRDGVVPRRDQDALVAAIAGARLLVYEGVGHAVHWEQPERFAVDLTNFLQRRRLHRP